MATLALLSVLAGCGRGQDRANSTVARVGVRTISQATMAHWMSVLAPQHTVSQPPRYESCVARQRALAPEAAPAARAREICRAQYAALRRQALDFLISTAWLTGEAAAEGVAVTEHDTQQALEARRKSFPNGDGEFRESLKAIGHTLNDLVLEIRGELAAQKIRQRLIAEERPFTAVNLKRFYDRNRSRFFISEHRYFDIVENLHGLTAAQRLRQEFLHGRKMTEAGLQESLPRSHFEHVRGEKQIIESVIFHARLNALSAPVLINGYYFLVKVFRITPSRQQSLAQVEGAISRKLTASRRRLRVAGFLAEWRRRWTARTDCTPGYVIPKCRQYRGHTDPASSTSFT